MYQLCISSKMVYMNNTQFGAMCLIFMFKEACVRLFWNVFKLSLSDNTRHYRERALPSKWKMKWNEILRSIMAQCRPIRVGESPLLTGWIFEPILYKPETWNLLLRGQEKCRTASLMILSPLALSLLQMVKRCVVGGCSNVASATVALHNWPSNHFVGGKWNAFVRTTRSDFSGRHKSPVICSDHFKVSVSVLQHRLEFLFEVYSVP